MCLIKNAYIDTLLCGWREMDEFTGKVAGFLVDLVLQYPLCSAFVISVGLYTFSPFILDAAKDISSGRWVFIFLAGFTLISAVLIAIVHVLQLTTERIIARPTPCCSTYNNPARYLCFILNEENKQVFYETTLRKCDGTDPNINTAAPFYIISSWIPSPNHFRTKRKILFHPDGPGETPKPYDLPEGYCVRANGPIIENKPVRISFYSLNGTQKILLDKGSIDWKDLEVFTAGWYLVSNCRTGIQRLLFPCKTVYISSAYVRLPQYSRIMLLEDSSATAQT